MLFRMWARRAPLADRLAVGTVGLVLVALLAWIAIPAPSPSSSVTTSGGALSPVAGAAANGSGGSAGGKGSRPASLTGPAGSAGSALVPSANGSPAPSGSNGAGGTVGSSGGGTGPTGQNGSGTGTGASGTTQGCSGLTPLKIGVVIPDIGSGSASVNGTFGIPPASEEQADFAAVFDSVNKAGGAGCHTFVGDYQVFNETDSSAPTAECLQFKQDKVFAILEGWLPESSDVCALQNKMPLIEEIPIPGNLVKQYYPYYMSDPGELDLIFHNFGHAVADMGYFSAGKGFRKVGVFYRDCIAGEYEAMVSQLEQAGVSAAHIDSYDVGCPYTPFAPPSSVEEAVLKFQSDGVTDVIPMNEYEDLQSFTNEANTQRYKPQYLIADDGIVATSGSPEFSPNAANFGGAVAITSAANGAIQSGLPETAPTKVCDKVMTSHGLPTVYQSGDYYAGAVCNLVWILAAGVTHDTASDPASLAAGLKAAGSVTVSFPDGPNDFASSDGAFGGQYWRPLTFQQACSCWKVTNPNFSASFP